MKHTYLKQALIAILASSTLPAFANDQEPLHATLDPLVVTFSKNAQPLSKTPAHVTVIDSVQLETNPSLNLAYSLKRDGNVFLKEYGGIGQVPEVQLRGTQPHHVLFLKDGVRLNSQNHLGTIFSGFIDTSNVSRVEILKSPTSVQHGSHAIGGTIQMVSKTPSKTGVHLTAMGGENNSYKGIIGGDIVHDGFYASILGQKLETDGTRIFNNQSSNNKAGYEQQGYHGKIGYRNDRIHAFVSHEQGEGVNYFNAGGALNNSPREFENIMTTAKISAVINSNFTVNGRYSQLKNNQNIPSYNSFYNTQNKEADLNAIWSFTPNQNVLIGATQTNADYISNTVKTGKQSITSTGYYLQHQYNKDKFSTQAGVRLEDNERFGQHSVYQVAGRYYFTPTTSVFANYGTAFRAPALSELYYFDESPWGNTYGNPELTPEKSKAYEVGISHKIGDNLQLTLSTHQTNIDNLINYQYGSPDSTYVNIKDKTKIKGHDLSLKYAHNDYYASVNYTHINTKVTNDTDSYTLAFRPKNTGTLTLGYDNGTVGVSTSVVARSKATTTNNPNSKTIGGYATVDADAYWQATPNLKFFSNLQNIGDVEYKTAPGFNNNWYINGGRQANIGITLTY